MYCSELVWQAYYYGADVTFKIPYVSSQGIITSYLIPNIITPYDFINPHGQSYNGFNTLKIKHPLLGIVSTIVGAISWVANLSYATLYIKYYQAFATNDPTYVRQTEHFYNYNNYTSLVKTRTWHFYSSRPY